MMASRAWTAARGVGVGVGAAIRRCTRAPHGARRACAYTWSASCRPMRSACRQGRLGTGRPQLSVRSSGRTPYVDCRLPGRNEPCSKGGRDRTDTDEAIPPPGQADQGDRCSAGSDPEELAGRVAPGRSARRPASAAIGRTTNLVAVFSRSACFLIRSAARTDLQRRWRPSGERG